MLIAYNLCVSATNAAILSHFQYSKAMNFTQKHTRALPTLSVLHLTAMRYTQFFLFFQYCTQKKYYGNRKIKVLRLSLYQSRNMTITQFTATETFAKSLYTPSHTTMASVTELHLNLGICQQLFKFLKFLLQYSLGCFRVLPMLFIAGNLPGV